MRKAAAKNPEIPLAIHQKHATILNIMTRNTKKSPLEIANELELKAQRARARAVKAESSSHPILSAVIKAVADANADLIALGRKVSGPNSFDNRTESLRLRLAWIEAERAYTMVAIEAARDLRGSLQAKADEIASALVKGQPVTFDADAFVHEFKMNSLHLDNLETAMNVAERNWREFTKKDELKADAAS
jgi:hypothetical protein